MERVITCPHCFDSDSCFEDVQETFSSYMCFNCGFMSNSNYTDENIENIQHTSQLIKDLSFRDETRNIHWYPSVVNMGKLGIIYPEGDTSNYVWRYARVVDIPEEERHLYENHTQRLDVDNAETFGQYEFIKACEQMGITRDLTKSST